jgi:uncharacterized membrane protein
MEQVLHPDGAADLPTRVTAAPARHATATANDDGAGAQRLANALGWFSIGLGLAQVVVPANVARLAGTDPSPRTLQLMRALGLREISSGIGILSGKRTDDWVRARVAGDMMDLALLGRLLLSESSDRGKTLASTVAVAGVTALDMLAAASLGKQRDAKNSQRSSTTMEQDEQKNLKKVRRAITINRSPAEVAAFWREHASNDRALSETVRFVPAPGGRGTEVHLEQTYEKPGAIAGIIGKLRHDDPAQYTFDELFALKQMLETGDVVISDAWINGPHKPHPAQPE